MNSILLSPNHDVKEKQEQQIVIRIIEACLREDLFGLLTQGKIVDAPSGVPPFLHVNEAISWFCTRLKGGGSIIFAITPACVMQRFKVISPFWYYCSEENNSSSLPVLEKGLLQLMHRLAAGQNQDIQKLFNDFILEAQQAVEQGVLCRNLYEREVKGLHKIFEESFWADKLLGFDRIASFTDHPFYPTARAKTGLTAEELALFAPEYAPRFQLQWLAIPKTQLLKTSSQPDIWPALEQIGLQSQLMQTHDVIPVHPLTWKGLHSHLPDDVYMAPLPYMWVRPTLSVRTVACVDHPNIHIKLPLYMRTLGARNIRLIKSSTIRDGFIFQKILTRLANHDPALNGKMIHVDEHHGAYVEGRADMAYIMRRYDDLQNETPVPVAALATILGDGRPVMAHISDRYFNGNILLWARAHVRLLLEIHMRLWLKYGIALEANQQNSVFLYHEDHIRLLMKDNDSARVHVQHLLSARADMAHLVDELVDERIKTSHPSALMEMFCTIILQLCIVAPFEVLIEIGLAERGKLYSLLQEEYARVLSHIRDEHIDIAPAVNLRNMPFLPVKYLLSAGTLLPKHVTEAADINKHYGWSGQNFLNSAFLSEHSSS